MKILHVIPSVAETEGGPSYAIRAFANSLAACGNQVTIATTADEHKTAKSPAATVSDGANYFLFHRNLQTYKVSFTLKRWLAKHVRDFDLVHIHALFSFSSLTAARVSQKAGVPYIVRPLGVLNRWGMENRRPLLKKLFFRFVELPILRRAAAIHYTTEAERAEANRLDPELAGLPSVVLPVPVDLAVEKGDADEFFRRFPDTAGKILILFLSRLHPKKGLDVLFRAFIGVKREEPNSVLVLAGAGDDDYVRSLRALADELGIASHVLWTGHLVGEEKAAAFAAANVYVLPSYSENFGIAAAEAMAAGVPTVITDQVALAEYATKRDAALVVPTDAEAVSKGIVQLLRNPGLAKQCAENGRRLVEDVFSPRAVGTRLKEVYEGILAEKRQEKIEAPGKLKGVSR